MNLRHTDATGSVLRETTSSIISVFLEDVTKRSVRGRAAAGPRQHPVTFQLDIHNFHLPKPRSPMEQVPNRVISTAVSPDSRSPAREGARGGGGVVVVGTPGMERLLCGLTFRAG
ncbi:unnamed protein product [Arctogadus glacialis]